jgi:hypothetical protein
MRTPRMAVYVAGGGVFQNCHGSLFNMWRGSRGVRQDLVPGERSPDSFTDNNTTDNQTNVTECPTL